jgi:hypothetical protein
VTRPSTSWGAGRYERAGRALDDHLASCPACQSGHGCPDGDDTAEQEYRAWRDWSREDPTAARSARIRLS